MGRRNRSPEEQARREKIRELLQQLPDLFPPGLLLRTAVSSSHVYFLLSGASILHPLWKFTQFWDGPVC